MGAHWIIVGVLTFGVMAILLLPFWRNRHDAGSSTENLNQATRSAYDLSIYKDQLEEIGRDQERGLLNADQVEAAKLEVQRRILSLSDLESSATPSSPKSRMALMIFIAVLVPAGAVLMYGNLGSPTTPDFPFATREPPATNARALTGASAKQLLERLKARLERQPNSIQGWLLLARSSMSLEQYDQAVAAYRKAFAYGENNPDIAVDFAEALAASSGAVVTDEARKIFLDAVARDPMNAKARYYLGLAHAQQGNTKEALQAWVDLEAISPPDVPWHKMIKEQVARAVQELGIEASSLKPSADIQALIKTKAMPQGALQQTAPSPAKTQMRGPTASDVEAAGQMSAEDRAAFIRSMVQRLADRLKENPNDRNGWLRLARAYDVLGEKEKAREARAKAKSLSQK